MGFMGVAVIGKFFAEYAFDLGRLVVDLLFVELDRIVVLKAFITNLALGFLVKLMNLTIMLPHALIA